MFLAGVAATAAVASINWSQMLIVLSGVIVAIVAIGGFIDKRMRDRQNDLKNDIREAVNGLSTVLMERLETKENVASIRVEMARMSERVAHLSTIVEHQQQQGQ